jgi:hypothetical protein
MLRNKIIMGAILMSSAVYFLSGCYKDKTVILDAAEVTRPVSFVGDIVPIFNESCNVSGCHASGGKVPNLTASAAYTSLITGNYVNPDDPSNSVLYQWLSGKKPTQMPVTGINKNYNALILAWIKQGAQSN